MDLLCSSKDILLRVMALHLSPESTLVEKVVMVLFAEVTLLESCLSSEMSFLLSCANVCLSI